MANLPSAFLWKINMCWAILSTLRMTNPCIDIPGSNCLTYFRVNLLRVSLKIISSWSLSLKLNFQFCMRTRNIDCFISAFQCKLGNASVCLSIRMEVWKREWGSGRKIISHPWDIHRFVFWTKVSKSDKNKVKLSKLMWLLGYMFVIVYEPCMVRV